MATKDIVIDVWANRGAYVGEQYLHTDKHGRLRMSACLVDALSCKDRAVSYYVGYVKDRKSIALGNPELITSTDANPAKFDKTRHYANAAGFYRKHGLPKQYAKYVFDGKHNGWLLFKLDEFSATDRRGTE